MQRVLALQHAWECPSAHLGSLMDLYNIPYDIVQVEQEALPDPQHYAAVIALGGPQHLYLSEQYPYLESEFALIRQAVAANIPFLGICLGGQLLAAALGGEVKQHSCREIGFYQMDLTPEGKQDPLFHGIIGSHTVFHWHEDTFDLPEGSLLLATNNNTRNQAFRYGEYAYGLQYHIELDEAMLDTWLYHPMMKESLLRSIGYEGWHKIIEDRHHYFTTYQEHTRILFENFLSLSALLPDGRKKKRDSV